MSNSPLPIYSIVGPTASGKTELSLELAARLGNAEIINCDSVQIYREIWIATAKITKAQMRGVPHHLIDYVSPRINYTASDWARDATEKIHEIESRGNIPILVGGTGFYLRSLRQPFFEGPKSDIRLRERLTELRKNKGAEHLYQILKRIDKSSAERLFPRDYVRVMRAIEVFFQTGRPISELQMNRIEPPEFASRIRIFVLNPPRDRLYQKINERAERHFAEGLVEEVKTIRASGINDESNALGAHGYRRVCEFLRGERTLESAVEQTKSDVRHYAKRQMTWFRREEGAIWLNGFGDDTDVLKTLAEFVES